MREFLVGTDWWTDCDDAMALRLLARAHRAGEIRIRGIGINACMPDSAASLAGFLRLEGVTDIPLGLDRAATDFGGRPPYQRHLAQYAPDWHNDRAEDAIVLYRRLLAAAETPLEIIEIGYPQVLAGLLGSPADALSPLGGLELVRQKVKKCWVMAGKWDENPGRENNFARNERSRRAGAALCRLCPVPITFLGWETGASVITGNELEPGDALAQALRDHGSGNGRSSWDPMLALLALTGDETAAGYDTVRGRASVDPETGCNHFTQAPDGPHCFVVKKRPDGFYQRAINEKIKTMRK